MSNCHVRQVLRWVLLAGMLAAPNGAAALADSLLLKTRHDGAGSAYCEFTAETQQKMAGPDGKPMQVLVKSVYGAMMDSAAAGDGAEVRLKMDRLMGSLTFRTADSAEGVTSMFDTDDPENENASPDHRAAFDAILNMPLRISLDAQGVATAIEGAEAIRQKLLLLGEQNFIAKSLADEDFADRPAMATFGETAGVLLPNREVKVGETWKKTQHSLYPHVGKVILSYECTLERIEESSDGPVAIIRFQGTVAKDADEKPAEGQRLGTIDGSFSGSARFSASAGRCVEIRRESAERIEIPPWWSKDPQAPMMKIESQVKTAYAVHSAAQRLKIREESARRVADARAKRAAEEAAAMAGPVEPLTLPNAAEAWLEWGGPRRDFRSSATGLANHWPDAGPTRLWQRPLGDGYSAILCDGAVLYTMYSIRQKEDAFQGEEVVVALDAKTGQTLWEHRYPAPWPKDMQMEFGPGPHSTPILVGDRLFTVGTTAQLHCVDKSTGRPIWSHDLHGEFKAALHGRGYGSSPIAYNGNIVLPVSSEKGYAIMAFAQSDGSVVWHGGDFPPGYASLLRIHAFGQEQLLAFTGTTISGLDPANAGTLWSVDHPTQFGANISTPVWWPEDQHVFISSAYGQGSRGIALENTGGKIAAKDLWQNKRVKIQHGTAVRVGDWIYASSGDFGPAFLTCVNAKTGELGWRQRGLAKANVLYADGKLIVLDEDGTLALVKADPSSYRLFAKAPGVCQKTAWTVPTLHGRTLFVRDRVNILALDLAPIATAAAAAR